MSAVTAALLSIVKFLVQVLIGGQGTASITLIVV